MPELDWSKVLDGVDQALEFFRSQGVKPTLRTLFYNLYSRGLIPNTRSAYQSLSKHLVKARKEGRYAWDCLEDKTRVVLGSLGDGRFDDDVVDNFKTRLENRLKELDLDKILKSHFDYLRPFITVDRWADQPKTCEVWIEKEALASTIQNWIGDRELSIRVNRGYSSWTFIYNNAEALKEVLENHDQVTVLYLGDLDPSGVDIERFLKEALEYFDLDPSQVKFERLGVSSEQVDLYHLPPKPEDAKTLKKLRNDPRMATYAHNYIVELDALLAYVPADFRKLVEEGVDSVWDQDIYEDLNDRADELNEEARDLLVDYKIKARDRLLEILSKRD